EDSDVLKWQVVMESWAYKNTGLKSMKLYKQMKIAMQGKLNKESSKYLENNEKIANNTETKTKQLGSKSYNKTITPLLQSSLDLALRGCRHQSGPPTPGTLHLHLGIIKDPFNLGKLPGFSALDREMA
ncbi:hypothetical protein STEG23_026189, partial [Scotinomys teguina]